MSVGRLHNPGAPTFQLALSQPRNLDHQHHESKTTFPTTTHSTQPHPHNIFPQKGDLFTRTWYWEALRLLIDQSNILDQTAGFFVFTNVSNPVSWMAVYFVCLCLYWCRRVLHKSRATKSWTVTQLCRGFYLTYETLCGFTCPGLTVLCWSEVPT